MYSDKSIRLRFVLFMKLPMSYSLSLGVFSICSYGVLMGLFQCSSMSRYWSSSSCSCNGCGLQNQCKLSHGGGCMSSFVSHIFNSRDFSLLEQQRILRMLGNNFGIVLSTRVMNFILLNLIK